ncbi:hypothetical protein, partial [Streptomyces sp. NRRL S-481]|uniref:hypothetical protein n=1 Tax=Streptomyces sp. NRRL S-481 TaxID=1463911 RepID=UPI001F29F3E0
FTPPLPASDLIEIVGLRGQSSFKVEFDADVTDLVLHLGSLASTLVFQNLPMGTEVTKLSGDDDFRVEKATRSSARRTNHPQGRPSPLIPTAASACADPLSARSSSP